MVDTEKFALTKNNSDDKIKINKGKITSLVGGMGFVGGIIDGRVQSYDCDKRIRAHSIQEY